MDKFQPLSGYLLLDFLFPTLLHYSLTLQGVSLFDVDQQHGASFYVIPTEFIDEVLVLVLGNCICQYQNYQRGFLLQLLCCLLIQLG
ncbi:hypothetical protein Csa_021255 [Cucumis sativus]|uniref:Uncharacterized protein n=1 Tax=Cucumis sativus TaxID=3659 RepID=A0A0A0LH90_CUCSA|nr:hypothetical protein Csa_021255 [Cucumis sativus]